MGVFAAFSGGKIFSGFPGFSAPAQPGRANCAGVFAPDGRLLFCTGKPGHARLAASGCSAPRTRRAASFPLNLSGRFAVCGRRGASAAPAAGAKRKDNLRFSFLFELLPFPCFLIWRRLPICDRFEIGERQRISSCVSFATCSQGHRYITATHIGQTLRRRNMTVLRNS